MMFVLKMQLIASDRVELSDICRASSKELLEGLVRDSACSPYDDAPPSDWKAPAMAQGVTTVRKYFKKGSLLEWCELPGAKDRHIVPVGTEDDWAQAARTRWQAQVGSLPSVG
jgi:hypothetical protein